MQFGNKEKIQVELYPFLFTILLPSFLALLGFQAKSIETVSVHHRLKCAATDAQKTKKVGTEP